MYIIPDVTLEAWEQKVIDSLGEIDTPEKVDIEDEIFSQYEVMI